MPRGEPSAEDRPASPTLAVVVNTLNEEAHLADCLDSVAHVVDEIVIVDMHSDDRTREIARRYTERIFLHERTGFVEPARQYAILKAESDWILLLDADERVTPELAANLRSVIQRAGDVDVFFIPERTWISGRWMQGTGFGTDVERHARLFRRGALVWPSRIHAAPRILGKSSELPLPDHAGLEHWAHHNLHGFVEALNRYTDREAEALDEDGVTWSLQHMLNATQAEIRSRYQPEIDGVHSLVMSTCMAFYRFLSWAKLWERQAHPPAQLPSSPRELFAALAEPSLLSDAAQVWYGTGFHADEGGWRWMSDEGELCVAAKALPAELHFLLTCDHRERYTTFPFRIDLEVGAWRLGSIEFDASEQSAAFRLPLGPASSTVHLRLRSETAFVPAETGTNMDRRRLSVRISQLALRPLENLEQIGTGLRITRTQSSAAPGPDRRSVDI